MRSRKLIGYSGSTVGIERQSNPAACSLVKTAAPSSLSTSREYELLYMPAARQQFVKATARAKAVIHRPARSTTSRSKLQKPTLPNGRWPRSESRLVWHFIATERSHP